MRKLSFHRDGFTFSLITAGARMSIIVLVVCAAAAVASPAQAFTSLHSFNGIDGALPLGRLVQGPDGNFYGTTNIAGVGKNCSRHSCGTIFKITPKGMLITVHNFCTLPNCRDGQSPKAGLVLGTDGNFYGTTAGGGASSNCGGCGTVFRITLEGKLTTLHSFNGTDGIFPEAGLVQGTDGNFYGTTTFGGTSNNCSNGCGTVFKITLEGELTTLHSFNGGDGGLPQAILVQGTDGNFYGTTSGADSAGNSGTAFKITPKGKLTTLHNFCRQTNCPDGSSPTGGLAQGTDGNFYGTTLRGGFHDNNNCAVGCGTVFKITPKGKLTTLHRFNGPDGAAPQAVLVQDIDGKLYGTTVGGGISLNFGTVFTITPRGKLTTLHRFNGADGALPQAGVVQGTDGKFYGTTVGGGTIGAGTVFRLSVGLGPS